MSQAAVANRVSKKFDDVTVLDEVCLEIDHGQILTLVGPNGAGKTTLTRILGTLLGPTSGEVIIDGIDAINDPVAVRRSLSIVPQGVTPDPFATPHEHIFLYLCARGVARAEAKARTRDVLERLGMWDRRNVRAKKLSGGYQRRVILGMALATRPRLLLLDEPTTALDPAARRQMWDMLTDVRDETSILITTHDMGEAQMLSDRVALLSDGKVVGDDTVANLLKRLPSSEKFVINAQTVSAEVSRFGHVSEVAGRTVLFPNDKQASAAAAEALVAAGHEFARQTTDLEDCYFELLTESGTAQPEGAL